MARISKHFYKLRPIGGGGLGVFAAFKALHTWKHQRKSSAGEEILIYAHALVRHIKQARNTSSSGAGKKVLETYLERLNSNASIRDEYHAYTLRAKIYYPSVVNSLENIQSILIEIELAVAIETAIHVLDDEAEFSQDTLNRLFSLQESDVITDQLNSNLEAINTEIVATFSFE